MATQRTLSNLEAKIMKCRKCPRLRSATPTPHPHIFFGKPENMKLLIVARNPGTEDDYSKVSKAEFMRTYKTRWLESRIGKYLLEHLGEEIVREHMFFCNVCKCSSPFNSGLEPKEVDNCFPFLKQQIKLISPKVIVLLGSEAKNVFNGNWADSKMEVDVYRMFHPAFFKHAPNESLEKMQNRLWMEVKDKVKELK